MIRVQVFHPVLRKSGAQHPQAALDEILSLAHALEVDVSGGITVPVPAPSPATLFGPGKVEELGRRLAEDDCGLAVVNHALTPVQQRNLEREWKVKVLDRTGLILEIFGARAATREGVMQVELAHLSYQKSRLVRSWTHLERQRGGAGFMGGPGETQIEADRRLIDEKIVSLRRQLDKAVRTRTLHRAARKKAPHPVVALVGYTNAGKSTLFNRLTSASVLAEDMLFATLDPTMRRLELPSGRTVILSDTVGFISDLPTQLVAAFRATLEEVLEADLILHVRNMAHPDSVRQVKDVLGVLDDLGIGEARREETMIELRNKIDLMPEDEATAAREAAARDPNAMAISAVTGEGCEALLAEIEARMFPRRFLFSFRFTHDQGGAISWLYDNAEVKARDDADDSVALRVEMTEKEFFQFRKAHGGDFRVLGRTAVAAQ